MRTYLKDISFGVILFSVPFWLPRFAGDASNSLVSATSAVFAIVAGFLIADAMSNYLRLQTLIAEEDASLISLAGDAKRMDGKNFINVHKAIDEYMIAQLDVGTLDSVFKTEEQFGRISAAIDTLRSAPERGDFLDHILSMKEAIINSRQEISLAAKKNLTAGHWIVLMVLASLVAMTALATRNGSVFVSLVVGFMIVGMQAVLVLLREVDSNHLLENKLAFENPREVFSAVSQPPYYPYFSSPRFRLPDEAGLYRLGKGAEKKTRGYEVIDTKSTNILSR